MSTQTQQFNYLQAIIKSAGSKVLYQDVCLKWKGAGILFLLLLSLIVSVPLATNLQIITSKNISAIKTHEGEQAQYTLPPMLEAVTQQIPELTFQNYQINLVDKTEHIIYDNNNAPLIHINTGSRTKENATIEAPIIITRYNIHFNHIGSDDSSMSIKEFLSFFGETAIDPTKTYTINQALLAPYIIETSIEMRESSLTSFLTMCLIFTLKLFLHAIQQIVIIAALGYGICMLAKIPLRLDMLLRLAAVSITPTIIYLALEMALFTSFASPLVPLLLHLAVMMIALDANKTMIKVTIAAPKPDDK